MAPSVAPAFSLFVSLAQIQSLGSAAPIATAIPAAMTTTAIASSTVGTAAI